MDSSSSLPALGQVAENSTSVVSDNNKSSAPAAAANSVAAAKKTRGRKGSATPSRVSLPRAAKAASREASPSRGNRAQVAKTPPRDLSPIRGSPASNMSTRRSARATGKAGSNVSAANTANTHRRSPRSAGPLPVVGTKAGNAYGTNDVVKAGEASGPLVAEQITGVIDDLLDVGNSANPGTRSHSFNNESGVFGAGHVDSSLREPSMMEEEGVAARQAGFGQNMQRQSLLQVAREQRILREAVVSEEPASGVVTVRSNSFQSLKWREVNWSSALKSVFAVLGLFALFFLVFSSLPSVNWYGFSPTGMKHNVGQLFTAGDLGSLQNRLGTVERDIFQLQQRGKVHQDTISRLEGILPDVIVGTKDKFGKVSLPAALWKAIDDKVRSDIPLAIVNHGLKTKGESGSAVVAAKDIDARIAKSFASFVKTNDFKVKEIDTRFSNLLGKARTANVIISKDEAIKLIRENWDDNQAGIKTELDQFKNELKLIARAVAHLEDASQSKSEVQAIAKDFFSKMLPTAQLSALAKANLQANINHGLTRVNHFAKGSGAVINVFLTSPNYVFPGMDMTVIRRNLHRFLVGPVPIPNSPVEALTKWEEHGDCWCSPSKDANGQGPSLAVVMASSIFPDEVVIEHILPTASLEPGSAPKELELLAYMPEVDLHVAATEASVALFPEESEDLSNLPFGYVRLATFTYDQKSSQNVQAFPVQLDTRAFAGGHTNKLIVRAKNNWGDVPFTCLYRVRVHGDIALSPGAF